MNKQTKKTFLSFSFVHRVVFSFPSHFSSACKWYLSFVGDCFFFCLLSLCLLVQRIQIGALLAEHVDFCLHNTNRASSSQCTPKRTNTSDWTKLSQQKTSPNTDYTMHNFFFKKMYTVDFITIHSVVCVHRGQCAICIRCRNATLNYTK